MTDTYRLPVISTITGETKRFIRLLDLDGPTVAMNVTTREWEGGIRIRQVTFMTVMQDRVLAREVLTDEEYVPIEGLEKDEEDDDE